MTGITLRHAAGNQKYPGPGNRQTVARVRRAAAGGDERHAHFRAQ
ncbi:hypothetical protein ACFY5D_18380 [Paeniglutamicibacter sp. NPDC012692]